MNPGDPPPIAGSAAGLVAYQSGTIVSRTLVKKSAGTATVFAFDAGQELSEHTAPYDALVFALDGRARWTVAGEARETVAGDVLLLPAGKTHAVVATSPFKMLLVMIRSAE